MVLSISNKKSYCKSFVFLYSVYWTDVGLICANSYKAQVTHLDLFSRGKTINCKLVSYMSRTYLGR